jgi:hypothetical protein
MFRTKALALELAQSKKENAELKAKLSGLDDKLEKLTQALLGQKLPPDKTATDTSVVNNRTAENTNNVSFNINSTEKDNPSPNQTMAKQQRQQGSPPPGSGSEAAPTSGSGAVSQGS